VGIGFSLFLFVVGAILTFAVDANTSGFSLNTVGIILMIGGLLGLLVSALFWSSFRPGADAGPWPAGTGWWRSIGSSASSSDRETPPGAVPSGLQSRSSRPSIDAARTRRIRDADAQC
jgi:hypothetical protein